MNHSRIRHFAWATFLIVAFGVFFTARYFCLSAVQAEQKFERPIYKTGVLVAKNPIFHEVGGVGAPNAAGAMGAIPEDADHRGPHFSAPGDSPTEREALRLAKELRDNLKKTAGGSGSIDDESRQRLKRAVESAFEERQRQETAELQKLRQRLDAAQKKLSNREQLKQKIVDRRVEELLNPGVKWEEPQPAHRGDEFSGGSRDAANENSGWSTPKPGRIRRLPNGVHMSSWSRRGQNQRDLAAAMLKYENAHKHFPPAAIRDKDQKPLLSWRVLLLPFLGEKQLYQEFRLNEPWDSAHNVKLLDRIPPAFRSTTTLPATKPYSTTILAPIGENTVFANPSGTAVREITDGTGKTVLLLDHSDDAAAVIWTMPEDWKVDAVNPRIGLVGSRHNSCTVIFCDGTTHSIDDTTPTAVVAAAFTFNSGDILPALPRIVSPEQTPPLNAAMFYVEINEAGKLVVGEQTVKAGKVWINKGRLITLERLRLELDAFPRGRRDDFYVILTPPRIFNAAVAKTQDEVLDLCDTMQIKSFVGIPKTSVPPSTADATPGIDPPRPISGTPPLTASPSVTPAGVPHQPHSDVKTKNEEAILKALGSTTTVAFVNTQLKDALMFLKDQHKINIYIDEGAFQEESIAFDTPVNLNLSNLTLCSVLNLILKPLALGFTIEDEVLKITTKTRLGQTKQPDEIVQFGPRNPAIQQSQTQIARTLADPAIAAFVDTQLKDALMFLAKKHKIQIVIDDKALIAESIPTDTPVNLHLSDVSLRSILNLILKPSNLTFSIEDEVLKIKPRQLTVRDALERARKAEEAAARSNAPRPIAAPSNAPEVRKPVVVKTLDLSTTPSKSATERNLPSFIMRTPGEYRKAIEEGEEALQKEWAGLKSQFPPGGRDPSSDFAVLHPEESARIAKAVGKLDELKSEFALQVRILRLRAEQAETTFKAASQNREIIEQTQRHGKASMAEVVNVQNEERQAKLNFEQCKALAEAYSSAGGPQGEEGLRRSLEFRCSVSFQQTDLRDVFNYLKEALPVKTNFVIDEAALAAEQIPADSRISLNVIGVKLRNLLTLILLPLKLTYVIQNDVIKITTLKHAGVKTAKDPDAPDIKAHILAGSQAGKTAPNVRPAGSLLRLPTEFTQAIKDEKEIVRAWEAILTGKFPPENRPPLADMEKQHPDLAAEITAKRKRLAAVLDEYQTQLSLLQINVSQAELMVTEANRGNDRAQKLYKEKAATFDDAANAKHTLDTAQLGLKEAKALYELYLKAGESAGVQPAASNKYAPKPPAPDPPKRP